jgi:hypothetical protein
MKLAKSTGKPGFFCLYKEKLPIEKGFLGFLWNSI